MAVLKVLICILIFYYIITSVIMQYLRNIPYIKSSLHDIFGIGEAVGAGISVGGEIAATSMTNKTNKEIADATNETNLQIHREANEFNAQEAEKSRVYNSAEAEKARQFNASEAEKTREFNSREAQKTREWNSETAVQQRLSEAGLNSAMVAGGISPTSSTASASPASGGSASSSPASASALPHLVAPQMQKPDIASAVNAGINFAKAESEISGNKKQAEKTMQETAESLQRTKFQELVNSYTPEKLNAEISYLLSQDNWSKEDRLRIQAVTAKESAYLDSAMMQGYNQWVLSEVQKGHLELEENKFMAMFSQHQQDVRIDAMKFADEWRNKHYENSYRFGSTKNQAFSNHDNRSYTDSNSSSISGSGSLGIKGFAGADLNGSNTDSSSSSSNFGTSSNSAYLGNRIKNTDYYKYAVEVEACKYILTNFKDDKKAVESALSRIRQRNLSVEAYALVLRQVGKIKEFPSNQREQ